MRIGILGPVAWRVPPRHYGGWENVTYLLAEGLVRRGHDVALFATADSETSARLLSVVPRPLEEDPSLPARVYETLHIAHALERSGEFDVLHNNAGVFGTALARLGRAPVLSTLHGSAAEPASRLVYDRLRALPYVSITDAERVLAPELNYVATVYNGIDTASVPPPNPAPDDYLLYLGRISPDKGVHHCVRVARETGRRLLIAGIVPESDLAYYETEIAPHVDGERIAFLGPQGPRERDLLMRDAYAFLHLIEYHEAFGLTMAESLAVGTPIVAFRRGSVPEVVRDGETGYIVDRPDEAAAAIAHVGALSRERCAAWARERFSAERMVAGYERVYAELAEAA